MCVCVRVCVGEGGGGRWCMLEGAVRLINQSFLHIYYYVLKNIC